MEEVHIARRQVLDSDAMQKPVGRATATIVPNARRRQITNIDSRAENKGTNRVTREARGATGTVGGTLQNVRLS